MNMKKTLILAASAVLMMSSRTFAQYAEDALRFTTLNTSVGNKTAAIGGTGIGIADDFSALFLNPAGLAQLRSYEFSVGLGRTGITDDLKYLSADQSANTSGINFDNIGIVYPIPTTRGSLTFAFGYGRVASYGGTLSYSGLNPSSSITQSLYTRDNLKVYTPTGREDLLYDDVAYQLYLADYDSTTGYMSPLLRGNVRQSNDVTESGGMDHWTFGGAMDVAENLSLGVSLNFASGRYAYDRKFTETDPTNSHTRVVGGQSTYFSRFEWESSFQSDLSGFDMLFGLMYRKAGKYRVGVTVRTPSTLELSETFRDEYRSYFGTGQSPYSPLSYSGETTYKIVSPWVLGAGVSFQVSDWLVLGVDGKYTDWTTLKFDSDDSILKEENRYIQRAMREAFSVNGGVEVTLWDADLKLRGGAGYTQSPYKNDPTSFDQMTIGGGLAFMIDDNSSMDISYSRLEGKSTRVNYSYPSLTATNTMLSEVTDESITKNVVKVGFKFRF